MNFIIDTHCHLYSSKFEKDVDETISRAKQNQVQKIFLPAIDHESHEALIQLAADNPGVCYPMMGVHPCSINAAYQKELDTALQYLNGPFKFYAIGEIGLDYYWDITFKQQQQQAFEIQMHWAIERNLPIVVHSRNSTRDCINMVKLHQGKINGVFHCFSGDLKEAKEIIEMGLMLGIGGVVTYKNTNLREVLTHIGLSHVVLETDAPYLAPIPHRGQRNEPAYTYQVAQTIADTLNMPLEDVISTTTKNAFTLFGLND